MLMLYFTSAAGSEVGATAATTVMAAAD